MTQTGSAELDAALPLLAADVGGTHVRLGLVRAGFDASRQLQLLAYRKYASADFAGLADIVATFLADQDVRGLRALVIASAGYALDDGTVIANNLSWPISLREMRDRFGVHDCRLVNDFVALAHAADELATHELAHLAGPERLQDGPVLVVGPGTGLGAALWIPNEYGPFVLSTEAGQAALAAVTDTEFALLHLLRGNGTHVPVERAISGPGLLRIHAALCTLRNAHARAYSTPAQISCAAQDGSDPVARESLELFFELLGSAIGDMALQYGAQGGVYLAGGILPQLRDLLPCSRLVERFLDKGAMRDALLRIPLKLVEHGQFGVIGAARWFLDGRSVSNSTPDSRPGRAHAPEHVDSAP